MASNDTTFVSKETVITAGWVQDVNNALYRGTNPQYVTSTGAGNAYIVTLPATSLYTALAAGDKFTFKADKTNTGAATLQIVGTSALTAKSIVKSGGAAVVAGDIVSGDILTATYDGTSFQIPSTPSSLSLPLTGGTMSGPINEVSAIVGSAATGADIWSGGNMIFWTGTATTTAFANAPQAGVKRTLICSGACSFVTGASFIVPGVNSGQTIIMKANAIVEIIATSTTAVLMTYSFGGSFTATTVGLSAEASTTWAYSVQNGVVHITGSYGALTGTSNSVGFTVGTFPTEIRPWVAKGLFPLVVEDNTSLLSTGYGILGTNGVLTLTSTPTAGWTASGTKALMNCDFTYGM